MSVSLEQRAVHTIRTLSIDAVQKANSGHPGMPMGMADVAYVLWKEFLRHSPTNPQWFDRDRFVLSAGHGSMLVYSLLHLTGYDVSMDDLKNFRQWDSITPGHPEVGLTPGVETTTGPLGQGFANGVGMALAEAHLAARYNTENHSVIDHYTFGIVSDGDLMEGISHEAASLAGHLKLGKLIYFYDNNKITIDGSTDLAFTEDVEQRFEAYGWHCIKIDGHDRDAIRQATKDAKKVKSKPSLILCRTKIGYGSPAKEGTADSHGSPLGDEEIRITKEIYGLPADKTFHVDDDVLSHFRESVDSGKNLVKKWNMRFDAWRDANREKSIELSNAISRNLPSDWSKVLPVFDANEKGMASRKASGNVLEHLQKAIPFLIGGSADLTGSNNTKTGVSTILQPDNYGGSYIHYGVREHAMGAMMNGMALHQGIIPYGGTFLVFSDYNRPAIRLAALSHIPSIFVFTHDSIGLGEDGPTHQPIEHLTALRAIPNLNVIRPADANETAYAWQLALERTDGPSTLVLTRQNLPTLDRTAYKAAEGVLKGAYTLSDCEGTPDVILMGSGSEVQIAIDAGKILEQNGTKVRIVSVPCMEEFARQDEAYRESVLPSSVKNRVAIEAALPLGWERFTGSSDNVIGINHFGASAPFETIYQNFGLTPEAMAEKAKSLLG